MLNQRSVVVFDLGGVLIDWNPRYVYRELFEGDEEKVDWFLANICTSDWNRQQDAGRSLADATRYLIEKHPEQESLIRAYYERWQDMLGGAIEETVEILADLKKEGHPLYALTNWSAETFPTACNLYDFLGWFDGIVVSGDVRMTKPDPDIYRHLMDVYRFRAEDAVFIDDLEANIRAAEALGFYGIHFQNPQHLREELKTLGFLS